MATKIQFRRDTAGNWSGTNPVLSQGEPGVETDTGKLKIGNGSDPWACLPYGDGLVGDNGEIAIGFEAGQVSQATAAIAIGSYAGRCCQGGEAVAMGWEAGRNCQGYQAVAIGAYAGRNCQGR